MSRRTTLIPLLVVLLTACGPAGNSSPGTEVPSASGPSSSASASPSAALLSGTDAYAPGLLTAKELPKALRMLKAKRDDPDQGKFLLPICGDNGQTMITDGALRQFGSGESPTALVDFAGFAGSEAETAMAEIARRVENCKDSYSFQRVYDIRRSPDASAVSGVDEIVVVHGRSERTAGGSPAQDRYEAVFRRGSYLGSLTLIVKPGSVSDREVVRSLTTFAKKVTATVG